MPEPSGADKGGKGVARYGRVLAPPHLIVVVYDVMGLASQRVFRPLLTSSLLGCPKP